MMMVILTQHDIGCAIGVLLGLSMVPLLIWWYKATTRVNRKFEKTSEQLTPLHCVTRLPSGRMVMYPEIHPLHPTTIKSMRSYAEQDRYHGATWDTITNLCDEVELLQMQNAELKTKLKEKS